MLADVGTRLVRGLSPSVAYSFDEAFLLQSDVACFTALSSRIDAEQVCALLHGLFSAFDSLAEGLGIFKWATVGGAARSRGVGELG